MLGLSTLSSVLVALIVAGTVGPLLGRLATQWYGGRGLSNLLTEVRGAFLPFLLAPLFFELTSWPPAVVIGTVVGLHQAIAVGRWVARRSGEWSPSLLGGIALGRSQAALLSARATARGAVIGTLALTFVHVAALEMLLAALGLPGLVPHGSIGAAIYDGAGTDTVFILALGTACVFSTEIASSWLFQHRPKSATK